MISIVSLTAFYMTDDLQYNIDFDRGEGTFEELYLQLFSLVDKDIIIVDYAGRKIEDIDDLLAVTAAGSIDGHDDSTSQSATVWMCDASVSIQSTCSLQLFGPNEPIFQPTHKLTDTTFSVCARCIRSFDCGLVRVCAGDMVPFVCSCKDASEFGFSSVPYYSLPLISLANPLKLFFKRQYLDANIAFQAGVRRGDENSFRRRLASGCESVKRFEEPEHQKAAREAIDMVKILSYSAEIKESLAAESRSAAVADDVCFMRGLLKWFKGDFFKWINGPPCDHCNSIGEAAPPKKGMQCIGMAEPSDYELNVCWAQRVELHQCKACEGVTRFPRVNNPSVLVSNSRRGRCGEWANAFCLICRTIGIDTLYCIDWTDHVWVEVWLPSLGRYVHADSCEQALDSPLVYETGWNKQLTYVIAFSRHSVVDTTTKYTRKYDQVLQRRNEMSEQFIQDQVAHFNRLMYETYVFRASSAAVLEASNIWGASLSIAPGVVDVSLPQLMTRKKAHDKELLGYKLSEEQKWKPEEIIGRVSGDALWKRQRGEDGKGADTI